jgi:hypothetical protein
VHDLTVAEFHNAHCVCWLPLAVGDYVFGDPKITFAENPLDVETRRFSWMMTPQGLQIASSEDSFTGLRVIENRMIIVNFVFRVRIACCRRLPMLI